MSKEENHSPLGFDKEEINQCVELLNDLLSNLQVHYQKLKNYHWNVVGKDFFELHQQFQSEYLIVGEQIDKIAERIRVLGRRPLSTLKEYLTHSNIEESPSLKSAEEMIKEIVSDKEILLSFMIEVIEHADTTADVSSSLLVTEMMRRTEKSHWKLTAYRN